MLTVGGAVLHALCCPAVRASVCVWMPVCSSHYFGTDEAGQVKGQTRTNVCVCVSLGCSGHWEACGYGGGVHKNSCLHLSLCRGLAGNILTKWHLCPHYELC